VLASIIFEIKNMRHRHVKGPQSLLIPPFYEKTLAAQGFVAFFTAKIVLAKWGVVCLQ
jgi:hypothetical protein